MNNYELTIILAGGATAAKKKKAQENIGKIVQNLKGKVIKMEDWGEKEFFHQIGRSETGTYLHFQLELETKSAKEIFSKLNFEEGVLKYLLIRKE